MRTGDIEIIKVDGDKNLGDALTKYLDASDTLKHCEGFWSVPCSWREASADALG